jgi:cytochrome c oxidase subunit 2
MKKTSRFVALLVAVFLETVLSPRAGQAQPEPHKIAITAHRFTYEPGEITLKKGEPVLLVVKSEDVPHGLRIRELNVDLKVPAHGTAQVQFTPDNAGDFVGHCSVFCGAGHGSMALDVHVVE